jgi:hypothetical protein
LFPSGALGAKSDAKTETFDPLAMLGTVMMASLIISIAAIPKLSGSSTMNHLVSS